MIFPDGDIDPRRIPIIGNDIYQVGQVYSIINQSCTPNPLIAVKAMFHYSPSLIWALLKPEPLDLAFERAGRTHKRKRYRKVRPLDKFQLDPTEFGKVGTAIFNLANLAERVGWYLIILDATTDWMVNWTSLAYQWGGCAVPNPNYAMWRGNMPRYIEPFVDMPYQITGSENQDAGSGFGSNSVIGLLNTGPFTVTYQGTPSILPYQGRIGTVTAVEIGLKYGDLPWDFQQASVSKRPDGTEKWTYAKEIWNNVGVTVQAQVRVTWTDGYLAMLNQVFQISGSNPENIFPDP